MDNYDNWEMLGENRRPHEDTVFKAQNPVEEVAHSLVFGGSPTKQEIEEFVKYLDQKYGLKRLESSNSCWGEHLRKSEIFHREDLYLSDGHKKFLQLITEIAGNYEYSEIVMHKLENSAESVASHYFFQG